MLGFKLMIRLLLSMTVVWLCLVVEIYAGELDSASARLAEQSFGLLDQLSTHDPDHHNPLVGPIAVFAGEVDSLHRAVASGDWPSAQSRLSSLQANANTVDRVLNRYPDATAGVKWSAIRKQLQELAAEIQRCGPSFASTLRAKGQGCRTEMSATRSDSAILNGVNSEREGPRILITSRDSSGGFLRLKGYFEGTALNSAGLYEGSNRLKAFKVSGIAGRQRVDFDLKLEEPSPATILRVSDVEGRSAEAPVLGLDSALSRLPSPTEIPPDAAPPIPPAGEGEPGPNSGEDTTTAEIPTHGPLLPSPSKRHTLVSKLGDVQIRILSVKRTSDLPPTYEVAGQIVGRGIIRAGIYRNGRLLQSIAITKSADYTGFERRVMVRDGSTAIRAYTAGNQFVEQPLDFSDADEAAPMESADGAFGSFAISANQLSIQITEIRPVAANVYTVSGVISGPNIASAGLYQNGVLAQNFDLSRGLATTFGALLPDSSRSFNFSTQFNPYAGPASVRAFDSTGAYSERPIIVRGTTPYGTAWPYSSRARPGNLPYKSGLTNRSYPGKLGSTRPLW